MINHCFEGHNYFVSLLIKSLTEKKLARGHNDYVMNMLVSKTFAKVLCGGGG